MAHLQQTRTRAELTPREWLKHGVQIARFVNDRAQRADVVAFIGDGAGAGHAACFYPTLAEIDLNRDVAFVKNVNPRFVGDVNVRTTLFDWPKAAGALIHEASHARWTTYDLEKGPRLTKERKDPRLADVIEYFEETRIENMAAITWPDDRAFLRASAMGIVLDDIDLDEIKLGDPYAISTLMLLTMARQDARVLDEDDVFELRAFFIETFTEEVYAEFRAVWREMHLINTDHTRAFEKMIPLAERWLALLPEPSEEQKAAAAAAAEALKEQLEELLEKAVASAETGGTDDANAQQTIEITIQELAEAAAAHAEEQDHEEKAKEVFSKSTAEMAPAGTRSRIVQKRDPTDKERAAAVILARALEKARYRDRIETTVASRMPPGRLDTSEAIRGLAQRSQRQMVTAEPWRHTDRRHVEDPHLTIGVGVDISGSMNGAMEPMPTTAWVLAEAGHRIQAQLAQVYYGNAVFPTLAPNQRMPKVVVRSAHDGVERFDSAFRALDGKLNLLNGVGARLLVICSDTVYSSGEVQALRKWTDRCVRAGVGVIILPFGSARYVEDHELNAAVQVLPGSMTAVETATLIGQAAVKALAVAVAR